MRNVKLLYVKVVTSGLCVNIMDGVVCELSGSNVALCVGLN